MIAAPEPLQWPANFARTGPQAKRNAKFLMTFPKALESLHAAMKKRGLARHEYVISSNLPRKNNGDPTPVGGYVNDNGIAVYWKEKAKPIRVVACDQFWDARHNLRAVALALEHLRDLERWGCTQLVEHIMEHGFALPGPGQTSEGIGDGMPIHSDIEPHRGWMDLFGLDKDAIGSIVTRDLVEYIYKGLARKAHPDQGGSNELMMKYNGAWHDAQKWFDWHERKNGKPLR